MKVAILAGGVGSRLSEETELKPKPMVEIGGHPIIWHIMKHYAWYGHQDFAIALGYKGEVLKRYMIEYASLSRNLTVNMGTGEVHMSGGMKCDWTVNLIDTGIDTQTGGRIKRLKPVIGNQTFLLTWGDGVSDVNIDELIRFHRSHGKLATLTAVRPTARFGHIELDGSLVTEFSEKPQTREGWINGAFFVLEPEVFDYVADDSTHWEKEPLENLARDRQLMAYQHTSFWQCMDTLREKKYLESLWQSGSAPWHIWKEQERANVHEGSANRASGLHRNGDVAHVNRVGT
jgi:glucose-1-phosphate cytidylyltransferase